MGYRSDGLWIITGETADVIAALVSAKMACPPPDGVSWDVFDTYRAGDHGYIKLQYDSWKWYDSYPDVQWLERCWTHWDENEKLSGKRIRIGEDDDDTDVDVFGDDPPELYVSRSINAEYACVHGEPLLTQGENDESNNTGR
jgi:hypothetical protein